MGISRSFCRSFNFLNTRFAVEVIFFLIKFYRKIYFHGKFVSEFCYFFFHPHICLLGSLLYRKQFSPSFDTKGKLQLTVLYLPKCFILNMEQYKNSPKKCRYSINYDNNFMQHIDWLLACV